MSSRIFVTVEILWILVVIYKFLVQKGFVPITIEQYGLLFLAKNCDFVQIKKDLSDFRTILV